MGWITLSQRKQELMAEISQKQLFDTQLSRTKRALNREYHLEKSIFNSQKSEELTAQWNIFQGVNDAMPSINDFKDGGTATYGSKKYSVTADGDAFKFGSKTYSSKDEAWQKAYETAKAAWEKDYQKAEREYNYQNVEISRRYDNLLGNLERSSKEQEEQLDEDSKELETEITALNAELEAIKDQIKTEIENSAISFE